MNEEEKQALEECKILMICLYDYISIEKSRFYCNQYKIILELIEKQQKEIEDLKFKYQARKDRTKVIIEKQQKEIEKLKSRKYILNAETNEIKEIPISDDYISKDKIKEKIKEVENREENYTFDKLTSEDIRRTIITNLEELLGE